VPEMHGVTFCKLRLFVLCSTVRDGWMHCLRRHDNGARLYVVMVLRTRGVRVAVNVNSWNHIHRSAEERWSSSVVKLAMISTMSIIALNICVTGSFLRGIHRVG